MANVRGGTVRAHVQAFADACSEATGADSFGTYNGHDPSIDRALDIFVPVNSRTLGDAICDFAIANLDRYGVDYIIYRQRIYNPEIKTAWRPMADRGGVTQNHFDHVHISFEASAGLPESPATPNPSEEDDDMTVFGDSPDDRGEGVWMMWGGFRKRVHTPQAWVDATALGARHIGEIDPDSGGKLPLALFDATIDIDAALAASIVVTPGEGGKIDLDGLAEKLADVLAGRLAD